MLIDYPPSDSMAGY